ncbi:protein muscleblind isoform X2 [Adelges cooleyi]|uniref:protein muscleblind isoform X2 n=1 Tax=Adelges cooleyi TaxID=133065 RepID=UPI0021802B24|nr:protein muscleblind isoform X2 [Adelges cooleyi]
MAVVNMNNLLNGKDSRWLQLEVCREYQRNKCSRPDTDCKFAHPAPNVEVQNGRVTACYDSIKGRCNREKPPCKYFHPPQHLKDQLLINGRNHLALKNALMQQMTMAASQQIVPGQVPTAVAAPTAYLTGIPGASAQVANTYAPYFSAAGPMMGPTTIITSDPNNPLAMAVQQTMVTPQKMPRNDRLDMDMKAVGTLYYDNFAFPGMMQYKRAGNDKNGMPVFHQQSSGTYQQLLQPFVPTVSFAAPPGIPRY